MMQHCSLASIPVLHDCLMQYCIQDLTMLSDPPIGFPSLPHHGAYDLGRQRVG